MNPLLQMNLSVASSFQSETPVTDIHPSDQASVLMGIAMVAGLFLVGLLAAGAYLIYMRQSSHRLKRRRKSRGRNPSLAEVRGLPPKRSRERDEPHSST